MKVIRDFKNMLDEKYIDKSLLTDLNSVYVEKDIVSIYHEISAINNKCGDEISQLLRLMTKLYCYETALKMNVVGSLVPDVKDPDNKYVQARCAFKDLRNKRVWVSHYLGTEKQYTNKMGHLIPLRIKKEGRLPLVEKTIAKLVSQIDEQ
jgi:hypothetical protein